MRLAIGLIDLPMWTRSSGGSPARAGIDPTRVLSSAICTRFPRTRGDRPHHVCLVPRPRGDRPAAWPLTGGRSRHSHLALRRAKSLRPLEPISTFGIFRTRKSTRSLEGEVRASLRPPENEVGWGRFAPRRTKRDHFVHRRTKWAWGRFAHRREKRNHFGFRSPKWFWGRFGLQEPKREYFGFQNPK